MKYVRKKSAKKTLFSSETSLNGGVPNPFSAALCLIGVSCACVHVLKFLAPKPSENQHKDATILYTCAKKIFVHAYTRQIIHLNIGQLVGFLFNTSLASHLAYNCNRN